MSNGTGSARFVDVTPAGVFTWIGQPERCLERDLIEQLLWRDPAEAIDFRKLADGMGQPVQKIAPAMFALNRQRALLVDISPPLSAMPSGLQRGLREDAGVLAQSTTRMVLAGRDGLCVEKFNCDADVAEYTAAGMGRTGELAPAVTFFFSLDHITVFADSALDRTHMAWVYLARRLLQTCGALSSERIHSDSH